MPAQVGAWPSHVVIGNMVARPDAGGRASFGSPCRRSSGKHSKKNSGGGGAGILRVDCGRDLDYNDFSLKSKYAFFWGVTGQWAWRPTHSSLVSGLGPGKAQRGEDPLRPVWWWQKEELELTGAGHPDGPGDSVESPDPEGHFPFPINLGDLGCLPKQRLLQNVTGSPGEIRHNFSLPWAYHARTRYNYW